MNDDVTLDICLVSIYSVSDIEESASIDASLLHLQL